MEDDAALLRRYVDERSEPAFAELVRRHVDLVYTVARRRHHDAAAVTREVFSDLAIEAGTVSRRFILVGWLHVSTLRHAGEGVPGDSANSLARVIDTALAALADDDRAALLLHYYERRSLADVGAALNLSEQAAGMCVRRSLDKLRGRLALLGHRMGPPAMLATIEQHVLELAPAGLAERLPGEAISAAATVEVTGRERASWFASLIGMINSGSALGLAAAIVIGGALAWGFRANAKLAAEITRLRGESQVVADLQRENRRMARLVGEAEELRREVVDLPALRRAVRPAEPLPASGAVSITLTPEGRIRWENEEITPADLLARLQAFRTRFPAFDSSVFIRGGGATISAVTHVVNESRKAGIKQILVEGEPRPDTGGWF